MVYSNSANEEIDQYLDEEEFDTGSLDQSSRDLLNEAIQTTGTAITAVPPVSRFSAEGGHGEKKQRVLAKLGAFFERFFGLSSNGE